MPAIINLDDLGRIIARGMTPAIGNRAAEAAAFCLESEGHFQGVNLQVVGDAKGVFELTWRRIHPNAPHALNDPIEATEAGATGVAVMLARHQLGYELFRRSRIDSRVDYELIEAGSESREATAVLEVSGIRHDPSGRVRSRVAEKRNRASKIDRETAGDTPVFVIVVEFGKPLAWIDQS